MVRRASSEEVNMKQYIKSTPSLFNNKFNNKLSKKTLLALTISAIFPSIFTQSFAAEKAGEVEVISVTATRSATNIGDVLASQVVITRADIERIQPKSVLDLLSSVAGVDIKTSGGRGQTASVFLRGAESGHTLVLVNGLRVSSASLGSTNLHTIAPDLIERIEVVKGPRAALWGSDAIGGVIQIFTRQLQGGEHFAGATFGGNEYQQYKAGIGFTHGDGYTSLSVNQERSAGFDAKDDGETDADGYKYTSVVINGKQNITKKLSLDWLLSADNGDSESDNVWGSDEKSINNHALLLRGAYQQNLFDGVNTTTMSVGQNRDASKSFGKGVVEGNGDNFETRRDQFSLVNNFTFSNNSQFNIGADYYNEDVSGTAYPIKERQVAGVFIGGSHRIDRVFVEAAVRRDKVEGVTSETSYNTGIGYDLSTTNKIIFNHGTAFKAPTFNDLYYPSQGNPNLVPEYSKTNEILFESNGSQNQYGFALYQSDVEDLIAWRKGTDGVWRPQNVNNVDIKGAEFSFKHIGFGGKHQFNATYNKSKDEATGKQLANRAKEKFNYQFTTMLDTAEFIADFHFVGKRDTLDSYQLLDLSVNIPVHRTVDLQVKVKNAFNEEYQSTDGYFTEDRMFYVGINYRNF